MVLASLDNYRKVLSEVLFSAALLSHSVSNAAHFRLSNTYCEPENAVSMYSLHFLQPTFEVIPVAFSEEQLPHYINSQAMVSRYNGVQGRRNSKLDTPGSAVWTDSTSNDLLNCEHANYKLGEWCSRTFGVTAL